MQDNHPESTDGGFEKIISVFQVVKLRPSAAIVVTLLRTSRGSIFYFFKGLSVTWWWDDAFKLLFSDVGHLSRTIVNIARHNSNQIPFLIHQMTTELALHHLMA